MLNHIRHIRDYKGLYVMMNHIRHIRNYKDLYVMMNHNNVEPYKAYKEL